MKHIVEALRQSERFFLLQRLEHEGSERGEDVIERKRVEHQTVQQQIDHAADQLEAVAILTGSKNTLQRASITASLQ